MTSDEAVQALLADSFGRVRQLVEELTDQLTDEIAAFRPDGGANSISWLVWHLTRIQDDHIADLAQTGQVWERWRDDFNLPFDAQETGYGHTAEQVGQVRIGGDRLGSYHHEVHVMTLDYVGSVTVAELDRIVDTRWDPPVTAGVRLVSILGDALQHLGQASYVRGLAERRGAAQPEPLNTDDSGSAQR